MADGLLFYHRLLGTEHGGSESVRPSGERGDVEIAEVEVQDADGQVRHMFRPGEHLRVALAVTAACPPSARWPRWRCATPAGERLFRTDETLGAVDGRVSVTFDIERLALLGGDYDVVVGAYDQDAPPAGTLDRLARFSVAATAGRRGLRRPARHLDRGRRAGRRAGEGGAVKPEDAPSRRARERRAARGRRRSGEARSTATFEFEAPTIERLSELAVIEVDHAGALLDAPGRRSRHLRSSACCCG